MADIIKLPENNEMLNDKKSFDRISESLFVDIKNDSVK